MRDGKMKTTKVLFSGCSQVVRLPKEFRFKTSEVSIEKRGTKVILKPIESIPNDWTWLDNVCSALDNDAGQR
jgi:antitoxin VapB